MPVLGLKHYIGLGILLAVVIGLGFHLAANSKVRRERDDYRAAYLDWKRYGEGMKASFDRQKQLRGEEQAQATGAVNAANQACDARVAEARRSAQAIKEIVYVEPDRDEAGCPVRSLVDPDRLRDALGAGAD